MSEKGQCFSCKKEIAPAIPVGRREECEHCGADLHVCKNCQFYDPASYNECKESSASGVREKERSNFCDYFQWLNRIYEGDKSKDLLAAAESLFSKKK